MAGGVARPTMMADSTSRPRFATGTAGRLAWQFDSTAPVSARAAAAGRGGFMGTAEPPAASGWLGFGLDCSNCTAQTTADGRRVWHFSAAPSIAGIEPGSPAELAGLEVGDVLREVDGVSLTWPAGAARFSAIKPGQKVKLTIVRKGKQMEVTMTARARGTRT
jgi:predicted metalloprotease with PDZ domain